MNQILVTGGAGYIGSHTVVSLIEQGYTPLVLDNFANSNAAVLERIHEIAGHRPMCINADVQDVDELRTVFADQNIKAVIHFAGLKAVGESVEQPLAYYQNNVSGTLNLLQVMREYGCKSIVFSSSATVYGQPERVPITEDFALSANNPYGQSKLMIENVLRDLAVSDSAWQISLLRYFNPVAAHPSGLIGEDPNGIPNNLMPFIAQVGVGKLEQLSVFGDDYDTPDGTGVRDYIHVVDLAEAHLSALAALHPEHGCQAYNIGTGQGYSVFEMLRAFERASGRKIAYQIKPRRAGDIAECFADTSKSAEQLNWRARHDLDAMMRDQWQWQSNNPNGYSS